ncbi:MAG: 4a-hydroxytetrahydrobiopterin dehydratase [Myxococcales bacterium]|nr:4a-hydroxytetrahydrobiopterin dehydratase [Myxococcales bacterium]
MWTEKDGCLVCEVKTKDFVSAFAIVQSLVAPSEAAGHHPDIAFGWGYVRITLTTHDQGRVVTGRDRALAAAIGEVLAG